MRGAIAQIDTGIHITLTHPKLNLNRHSSIPTTLHLFYDLQTSSIPLPFTLFGLNFWLAFISLLIRTSYPSLQAFIYIIPGYVESASFYLQILAQLSLTFYFISHSIVIWFFTVYRGNMHIKLTTFPRFRSYLSQTFKLDEHCHKFPLFAMLKRGNSTRASRSIFCSSVLPCNQGRKRCVLHREWRYVKIDTKSCGHATGVQCLWSSMINHVSISVSRLQSAADLNVLVQA